MIPLSGHPDPRPRRVRRDAPATTGGVAGEDMRMRPEAPPGDGALRVGISGKVIFKKRGLLTGFGLLDSAVSTSPRAALPHWGRLRRRAESARGEVSGAGLVRYKSGRKVGGKFVVGQKKTTLF